MTKIIESKDDIFLSPFQVQTQHKPEHRFSLYSLLLLSSPPCSFFQTLKTHHQHQQQARKDVVERSSFLSLATTLNSRVFSY
ncbi:hypothetical protein JHK82_012200 [Glycine max]|uniref:Uncharacterized protein n=2 Tax=Glycine subgen. Soja TaxID=1462606 RepID=A0A0R0JXZ5_SOYBN|nr:hypothetical protein JHK85_012537 [Glycine max]KAG5154231.1 hypothetical protein JHK82_012200 [Glycine max]KAH1133362.1 hypothetical protein GYH30_011969 [Glycine max]KRH57842.1 hypothetical protein GLYMA_05G087500v4 [Glycine max]RZC11524.1 hypothetical protein D0Y65_011637 [Glycine soja]